MINTEELEILKSLKDKLVEKCSEIKYGFNTDAYLHILDVEFKKHADEIKSKNIIKINRFTHTMHIPNDKYVGILQILPLSYDFIKENDVYHVYLEGKLIGFIKYIKPYINTNESNIYNPGWEIKFKFTNTYEEEDE